MGINLGAELLAHKVLFVDNAKQVSYVEGPHLHCMGFCFSMFDILSLFNFSHSGGCVVIAQYLFVIWIFSSMT